MTAFQELSHPLLRLSPTSMYVRIYYTIVLSRLQKKPVDFDDELKVGDVRYDDMTKITIRVQLF